MSISVQEAGRKGGICTRERYGSTFFAQIGAKGGKTTRERYKDKHSYWGKIGGRPPRPTLEESSGKEDLEKGGMVGPGPSFPDQRVIEYNEIY